MKSLEIRWIAVTVWLLLAAGGSIAAQAPKGTFNWFAELIAFDPKTNTMTVRAPIEPHVARYAGAFKPGDHIAVVWSHFNGNADIVRYVVAEKDLDVDAGYVVRGRFVGVDAAGRTLTFATRIAPAAATPLAGTRAGTPIRASAPLIPSAALTGRATAVSVHVTAPRRPEQLKREPGQARQVAGTWTVQTTTGNPRVEFLCTLTQDVNKLAGTCKGDGAGDIAVANGSVDRDIVSFSIAVPMQGAALPMHFRGTLNPAGAAIAGKAGFLADSLDFEAAKR